ncbi:AaceriAAL108Cp [[Ashbya] aceris (nom. inval.)]|nr:AaceriAAL108Cp [[Ashbya] aceris (nom. inval.)]
MIAAMNIAMVCDFFYPQLGGVEFHIYHLSQKLIELGHSVIIITHAYGDRTGVRYLTNGLKVYYVPYLVLYRETTFPTVFASFPIIRNILLREQVELVHSHVSVSTLAHESILHANTLGIYTVFTDHSLYGFESIGSILVNKLLKFTLTCVDQVICVSHTCKENMVLRADIDPATVSVIPNAVVGKDFKPLEADRRVPTGRTTIVVISRLFPNKGAGLLTHLIPRVCEMHSYVDFIIAGDGPNFVHFQQMIESYRLQDRVQLLGAVQHENVREVMCLGDIYLHASLTEAFGTVLVEAASCGLLIVTTKVGGIPEVLPEHMTVYASETSVSSLVEATNTAIEIVRDKKVDRMAFHEQVSQMYDWMDVARRTVQVYEKCQRNPANKDWNVMLKKYYHRDNAWARTLYTLCCITEYILWYVLEWWYPRSEIDLAPKWPKKV